MSSGGFGGSHICVADTYAVEGAASAAAANPMTDQARCSLVRDLASPDDDTCLSGLMCLLREQLEVFAATSADVSDRTSKRSKSGGSGGGGPSGSTSGTATGASKLIPITPGRVGIRCKHCAHLPRSAKAKGAVSYPNSIRIMNQAVRNWQRHHFGVCKEIPMAIKDRYDELKAGKRMHSSKASQEYWPRSCHELGLVDGPDGGIFFDGDVEAVQLYEEAAAAAGAAAGVGSSDGGAAASKPKLKPKKKKATKKNKRDDNSNNSNIDAGSGQQQMGLPDMSQLQSLPQHLGGTSMGSYPNFQQQQQQQQQFFD